MKAHKMLPNFFVVGAQKAGTTSYYYYISEHPDICMSWEQETHYYDIEDNYNKGLNWYKTHFAHWSGQKAVGDNSPLYMYWEDVPELIAKDIPHARLIFLLRSPVDRAWSHYWHQVKKGRERLSFREAVAREQDRIKIGCSERRRYSYVDRGKYIVQIERFLMYFSREQMHFILTEEMRERPKNILKNSYAFLDIDTNHTASRIIYQIKNKGKVPRSRKLSYLLFKTGLGRIAFVEKVNDRLNLRDINYKMDTSTKEYLQKHFEEYNNRLADFLDRDLTCWKKGS